MLLPIHIIVATTSLFYATYLFFNPSRAGLRVAYGMVTFTIGSGTYLVISLHASILHSCISGLAYLGAVSVGILSARHKLALASVKLES